MKRRQHIKERGFSIIETLVVIIISSIMIGGVFTFFLNQNRWQRGQRIVATVQSIGTIGFYMIGRDVRMAGSNEQGVPTVMPIKVATPTEIRLQTDRDGDGDVDEPGDDITYRYDGGILYRIDNNDPAGTDPITIENISAFTLSYQVTGSDPTAVSYPAPGLVRGVNLSMTVSSDQKHLGKDDYVNRNFFASFGVRNLE